MHKYEVENVETLMGKINSAVSVAWDHGSIDGDHHKMWVIDQMLKELLTKNEYDSFVSNFPIGDDGPETFPEWDPGIAP